MLDEYPNGQHHEPPRNPHWPAVERTVLHLHPYCACCGPDKKDKGLQVHHWFPFHYCIALGRPDLEIDPRNLFVLCETERDDPEANHHLLLGHLGNFKSDNPGLVDDIKQFAGLTATELLSSPAWQARKAQRLKLLTEMSNEEKAAYRALMDATFPLAQLAQRQGTKNE